MASAPSSLNNSKIHRQKSLFHFLTISIYRYYSGIARPVAVCLLTDQFVEQEPAEFWYREFVDLVPTEVALQLAS